MGEEHFGGFLTKVDSSTSDEKKKTWKEKMEEIISKSKKAKVSHLELFFNFHTYNCNLDNIFIAVHTVFMACHILYGMPYCNDAKEGVGAITPPKLNRG